MEKAWWAFKVLIKCTALTLVRPATTRKLYNGQHRLADTAQTASWHLQVHPMGGDVRKYDGYRAYRCCSNVAFAIQIPSCPRTSLLPAQLRSNARCSLLLAQSARHRRCAVPFLLHGS